MNERKTVLNARNIALYILGFFIIGLGVNLQFRSNLGVGAWDATNFNLNDLISIVIPGITKGTTSLMISSILFISVMVYRKWNIKLFIMLIPMFTISFTIDFWDLLILNNFHPESLLIRSFLFVGGGIILPLGLVFIIASNFPATVYDEFTIMLIEKTKSKNFGIVRLAFEVSGVVIAVGFSLLAGTGLGSVNVGTLIMAITLGPLMQIFMKLLGVKKNDNEIKE